MMIKIFKPKITLFHCINALTEGASLISGDQFELKTVKLPCSGMVKDLFLLRAFESGADAVIVMVCPEEICRYVEGSIRAKKRVEWVKKLLDEIGIDGRRLSIFNIASGDESGATKRIQEVYSLLSELGPNPAV